MTIFEKILKGKVPADIVFEDEWVLAFKDIKPQAPIHVIVIPKDGPSRLSRWSDQSEKLGSFWSGVLKTIKALGLEEDGYRVVVNEGSHGGQTVFYLHAHILGGRPFHWPPG